MYIPGISNPVADAISWLYESEFLSKFCNFYCFIITAILPPCLLLHMSVVSCSFLFFRYCTGAGCLVRQLAYEVFKYKSHTFADSTKGTYRTYLDCYMRFCLYMGFPSIPASSFNICLYTAFLARSLKASSVRQSIHWYHRHITQRIWS